MMKYCPNCQLSVGGAFEYCPLCQNELIEKNQDSVSVGNDVKNGEDIENCKDINDDLKDANYYFPDCDKLKTQSFWYKLQLFIMCAATFICFVVDFLIVYDREIHFSLIVLLWVVGFQLLLNKLIKRHSLPSYFIFYISIYIYIQFFENIPISLDESGIVDGASYFTIFYKILLPLVKPAIVTSCILKGVGTYNEYYSANLYLQDKKIYPTVATSLYTFVGPLGSKYNLICAGVIISLLPALIVFITCQKQIYSGITAGAVKG